VMDNSIPSVQELIDSLIKQSVKNSAENGLSLLVQQRVNQQVIEHLLALWHNKNLVTEVRSEVYVALRHLKEWLSDNHDARKYKRLSAQFMLLEEQIGYSLEQGKLVHPVSTIRMPPGSPIGS